jgi:Putative homoserine kinase type II (protein kinase fold)
MRTRLATAQAAAAEFAGSGIVESVSPYGSGHINASYSVESRSGSLRSRVLLQELNCEVFREPEALMDNVLRVSRHLRAKLEAEGVRDLSRRVLTPLTTRDGQPFWRDEGGGFWRAYFFIEGAVCSSLVSGPGQAELLGAAIGRFQGLLADLPRPRLAETIPHFHDARSRYSSFETAVSEDEVGRAASAAREIDFLRGRREGLDRILLALESGAAPERITHNDAKLENILLDAESGEALCVVDLDTVMPGASAYDFGDLARTVPATAREDEEDASLMRLDMGMYEALARGYAAGCVVRAGGSLASFLVEAEKELLPWGARIVTTVQALRFLADYLRGDVYYRVDRPGHNLDRARTQIALLRSMEGRWPEMVDRTSAALEAAERLTRA